MWTVLLQPETGRLYAPAGRRWIFPKPREGAGEEDAPKDSARESQPTPDDWTVFGWDSFFNALALATASGRLAWDVLLAGLESRYPNGNVPNWRSRLAGTPDRSQPPVGSFAALKLHLTCPDMDALAAAWPGLRAWSDWWVADKDGRPRREGLSPGLLSWGSDAARVPGPEQLPKWEVGASGHQRAAWESGQDDLTLWEEAEWDSHREVLAMSAVDLCSYRALDLECLSRIARILGDPAAARRLEAERRRLIATMNEVLWCDAAGLYLDELPEGHSPRVAASNFLPLIAGVPSARQARRMVGVLLDPARFWGEWVLPTISRDDPAFDDQQYWRGSIWPPMNYLVLQGLAPLRLRRPRRRPRLERGVHVPGRPAAHGLLPRELRRAQRARAGPSLPELGTAVRARRHRGVRPRLSLARSADRLPAARVRPSRHGRDRHH